ncbi:MAG: response regulator, partial [Proteobacteria bacterium]|nr:response regulator [Pseudomonadota bacterium]
FNRQWSEYTGMSLEESYGHGWNKPFHPDDQQVAWNAWQNAIHNLAEYSLECRLRRFDGQYFWWLIRGVPTFGDRGQISKWYGTCTSIQDIKNSEEKLLLNHEHLQKMVEQLAKAKAELQNAYDQVEAKVAIRTVELAESEQRHRLIIETMTLGALIYDQSGHLIAMNKAAQNILGMEPYKLNVLASGEEWGPLFYEDGTKLSAADHPTQIALRTGAIAGPLVIGFKGKQDNLTRWISISAVPIMKSRANEVDRVYTIFEDITERQLAKIAVMEARGEALRLAKIKTDFLANMSHEIRTPMNGIIGLSELALNEETSPKLRNYIQNISTCSKSLLGILNDILDLSKLEADRLAIEKVPFDLNELIQNIRNLFEERSLAKQLKFQIEIQRDIPQHPIGDPLRIQQILANLLGFAVEDTGIGIASEDLEKLFHAFSQVDSSITRRFGGSGLGLAISQKISDLLGGKITVTSQVNQGSEFCFELQMGFVPDDSSLKAPESILTDSGSLSKKLENQSVRLRDMHILVAEDDLVSQQVIQGFLNLSGIAVTIVNNGQEALNMLHKQNFDCVLMDVQMPIKGGISATQEIRANPKYSKLPIIALTAGITEEERDICLQNGMNDIIAKPVNPYTLIENLERIILQE